MKATADNATVVTESGVDLRRYEPADRATWDEFVRQSRNGTFLHERGYLEYHADRFDDHSLMVFLDGEPAALLPACRIEDRLVSHGGLTYGGFVVGARLRTRTMLDAFAVLVEHGRREGLREIVYKTVPHVYHVQPAEEDLYALFRFGAALVRRDVSSTVPMANRPKVSKGRASCAKQAKRRGLVVQLSDDYERFMEIEAGHLDDKYGTTPTHTAAELRLLAERFPRNIRLHAAFSEGEMVGGVVVYLTPRVAHAQYIAATAEGFEAGATDLVLSTLLNEVYADRAYFDFGISTEDQGRRLNAGLIRNKESFGGRAVCYDHYRIDLQ